MRRPRGAGTDGDTLPVSCTRIDRRLPAEWERHRATWCAWPHNRETWPGIYERIPEAFARLIRVLRRFEEVRLIVRDEEIRREVEGRDDLGEGFPVTPVEIPTNDAWVRDYGPIFTRRSDGGVLATVWSFNAWGGKYPPWDLDDAAGDRIARFAGVDVETTDLVLEGGSIDTNGRGTILTTESCLLHPNRNPRLDRRGLEEALRRQLGCRKVLWLGGGIAGDDTDGHVDDLARFVDDRTVVTSVCEDPEDPDYEPLRENLERLRRMRDQDGRSLRVVELPVPGPVFHGGERMPASYVNFSILNGAVVVPTFRSDGDSRALERLSRLFSGREVVGVDFRDLILGLGGVHCMTLGEPG